MISRSIDGSMTVTHAMADYQDLFVERFSPDDPSRYEFRGEWRMAERRRESIEVRGRKLAIWNRARCSVAPLRVWIETSPCGRRATLPAFETWR